MALNKIRFNDCIFLDSILNDNDENFDILEFNYCTFTDSQVTISAGISATETNGTVNYNHCTFNWDKNSQDFPSYENINKTNIIFDNYGLSSTTDDRSTVWSTSGYNTGFWNEDRQGAGAWFFNTKGHIGAFYFGELSGADVTVDPLQLVIEFQDPTVVIGNDVTVSVNPLNLFLKLHDPIIYSYEDIEIDFVGVPRLGTTPLDVDFTATVNLLGDIRKNYRITNYRWQYDYDRDVTTSAAATVTTSEYTFSGYSGKQFSINLQVTLTHKISATTIVRTKYKKNYITICGQQQPVRLEARRLIDIKNYLPDYLKDSDIYELVDDIFEEYLNTMYDGNRGYTYSEEDL